jgi:hypothetical protein
MPTMHARHLYHIQGERLEPTPPTKQQNTTDGETKGGQSTLLPPGDWQQNPDRLS